MRGFQELQLKSGGEHIPLPCDYLEEPEPWTLHSLNVCSHIGNKQEQLRFSRNVGTDDVCGERKREARVEPKSFEPINISSL